MGIVKFSVTILIIFALLSPGLSAGGFQNSGIGTQAMGMAGAFRAIANDWTAAYYNPAGYANIKDNQLGATLGLVHLRNELIPNYLFGDQYESGMFNDQTNYNKHEILSNPSTGFVARLPIWGETVMGISAYQPFDYNITWNLYDFPLAYNDSLTLPESQYSNNIDVVAFQLTLARKFMEEKMSLGVGLQVLRADLRYTDLIFRDNLFDGESSVRPFDKITELNHNDGNGYGFGLNMGMLLQVNEKLNFGLTASLPFDITISGDAKLEYFMPKIRTLINNPPSSEYDAGTARYLFASGANVTDYADFETKLKLPPTIGFGLAYQVTENLTVALDAEYVFWSKYKGLDFTFSNHHGLIGSADTIAYVTDYLTSDYSKPVDWDNAGKVMLGMKYNYKTLITFLGGASIDQSPARNALEITPLLLDTGDKFTISGGAVYHYQQWDFGVITSYSSLPDLTVTDLVDTNNDGLYDSYAGDYKANTYETVVSFNYRF